MTVLLDTNVLSEPTRPRPEKLVLGFLSQQIDPLISSLTLHEIAYGAERARDPARRASLISWVAAIRAEFEDRIINVDADIAEHAGRLRAVAQANGDIVSPMDALIGATASVCGVSVATRNVKDFAALGVNVINPWNA